MSGHIPKYGTFFEFKKDEVLRNRIKAYPSINFSIYSGSIYYNNTSQTSGNYHTPNGSINLFDLNVNRNLVSSSTDPQMIFPFIEKNSSLSSFKTISTDNFNSDFNFGDQLSGSYPLTASISIDQYGTSFVGDKKKILYALQNTLDYYTGLSEHYAYSSSLGDKTTQKLNIISIPSIFYGSSIKKGSVNLKFYITGSLIAEASDKYENGVLYQTTGSSSDAAQDESVGIVLYNEGFIILTSSAGFNALHDEVYDPLRADGSAPTPTSASWYYFGVTGSASGVPSSSFSMDFKGVNYIETVTMFAHAREKQLNYSNNPTFITSSLAKISGSSTYYEDAELEMVNIVSSSYKNYSASFENTTYISKIGIYDEDKNLIAIASIANPVKKTEDKAYTFKLKLDI